jgi:hypothetical protein
MVEALCGHFGVIRPDSTTLTPRPEEEWIRRLVADLRGFSHVIPNDIVLDAIKNLGKRLIEAAHTLKLIRDQPDAFAAYAPTKKNRNHRRRKVSFCCTGLACHIMWFAMRSRAVSAM